MTQINLAVNDIISDIHSAEWCICTLMTLLFCTMSFTGS